MMVRSLMMMLTFAAVAPADDTAPAKRSRVYVGTYTDGGKSRGIYLLELDPATGALTAPSLVGEAVNPSYLAIQPGGQHLLAVNEVGNFGGKRTGSVASFAIDPASGKLTPINQQPTGGAGPCFITIDRDGKAALVANYGGGSVAALAIGPDGRVGPPTSFIQHQGKGTNPNRQEGPHAHSINLDAENRFAIAADLGLDKLLIYRFDAGALTPHDPPFATLAPGSGPRHLALHPDGRHAYVINELNSTVTAFDYDPEKGTLKDRQTITTLPADFRGANYPADIHVHPSGKFLYGSNRGHDSIAAFAIDPKSGALQAIGQTPTGGKNPRNFAIDPSGRILLAANQDTNNINTFLIDPETGRLKPSGHSIEVPKPVCLQLIPINN